MKVNLIKNQFEYLEYILSRNEEALLLKLQDENKSKIFLIEVDENTADAIRDWVGEELQRKGFDLNYELTIEGKISEELIDAFYIE